MNNPHQSNLHLGVCSWSLRSSDPGDLTAKLRETGLSRVQLGLDPFREQPVAWENAKERLTDSGFTIVSGMCKCVGEDYSTLETIRETGGIVPDNTWEQNLANMTQAANIASGLGLRLVTFHAGFLPDDPKAPTRDVIRDRLRQLADLFGSQGVGLALETGQETATTLGQFLEHLDRPAVGVNFDPANMILYDKGDPIESLKVLGPWIRQVHIKDARRTTTPGSWGTEVPVGQGEVDWKRFFDTLHEVGFEGDCCIEREAGQDRRDDIQAAREHVEPLMR